MNYFNCAMNQDPTDQDGEYSDELQNFWSPSVG